MLLFYFFTASLPNQQNMKKTFYFCCILTVLVSCGNKNTGNIIPVGNEAPPIEEDIADQSQDKNPADPELITDRVKAIYAAVA